MSDLLFLAHRIPYPPDKGDKIRAWNIFRHLARTHRMHLGCFIDDPADRQHLPALRSECEDMLCLPLNPYVQRIRSLLRIKRGQPLSLGYFHDMRLQRWVDAKLASRAVKGIYVFSSSMAQYVMDHRGIRRVLDMVDVDSEKFTAYAETARFPARTIWAREGRTLLAFEREAAAHFDHSLFVSEHEWQRFVTLAPETVQRTSWISNGVDFEYFSPANHGTPPFVGEGADVVFTGRMDYWPNIDAVRWFAHEIMPVLRQRVPAARFWIVGAAPSAEVQVLAKLPGVQVTGRVPDTRPWLAAADVVVAPLRIARGIQNKLLEAMAMARPVVATPEAFEGVQAVPGRDILLASGVDETVQMIAEVFDGRHADLGSAARLAVEAGHRWAATLRPIDRLFGDLDSLEHGRADHTGLPV
jgi:sugar transferase (PEP-CTERM/EpsH1 system associated)